MEGLDVRIYDYQSEKPQISWLWLHLDSVVTNKMNSVVNDRNVPRSRAV